MQDEKHYSEAFTSPIMYNHFLVPDGAETETADYQRGGQFYQSAAFLESDTIPCPSEWAAQEAVEILKMPKDDIDIFVWSYFFWLQEHYGGLPSQYLSDLISLKRLTVEEIRRLSEVQK